MSPVVNFVNIIGEDSKASRGLFLGGVLVMLGEKLSP